MINVSGLAEWYSTLQHHVRGDHNIAYYVNVLIGKLNVCEELIFDVNHTNIK